MSTLSPRGLVYRCPACGAELIVLGDAMGVTGMRIAATDGSGTIFRNGFEWPWRRGVAHA